jgi:predicted nucleic acid binding AN1-type Zn finger protein
MSSEQSTTVTPLASARTRCEVCQKRVKLGTPVCKCNGVFCAAHVFYTEHTCAFDYKRQQRELRSENPLVIPEKLGDQI